MNMTPEAQKVRRNYKRQYRCENREKINAQQREWRANNPAKVREYQRRYWEKRAEKMNRSCSGTGQSVRIGGAMDDLMAEALHSMIHKQFESWDSQDAKKEIENAILHGCGKQDSMEEVFVKMLFNAMKISAEISAKVILEMLLTGGVIKPADEKQLRKDILSVVKKQVPVSDFNREGEKTKE